MFADPKELQAGHINRRGMLAQLPQTSSEGTLYGIYHRIGMRDVGVSGNT